MEPNYEFKIGDEVEVDVGHNDWRKGIITSKGTGMNLITGDKSFGVEYIEGNVHKNIIVRQIDIRKPKIKFYIETTNLLNDGKTYTEFYAPQDVTLTHTPEYTQRLTAVVDKPQTWQKELGQLEEKLYMKWKLEEPKVKVIKKTGLKSIERNKNKLTFLWHNGDPIVLTKSKNDKEDLGTAFVYAYFMHTMGWSKSQMHKYLDNLETSQDKRKREKAERAEKAKEKALEQQKEYKKKVEKEARKQIKIREFWDDVENEIGKKEKK